jgi:hypothetical protein
MLEKDDNDPQHCCTSFLRIVVSMGWIFATGSNLLHPGLDLPVAVSVHCGEGVLRVGPSHD